MTETAIPPLDPDGLVWEHFGRLPVHRLSNGLREAMYRKTTEEIGRAHV